MFCFAFMSWAAAWAQTPVQNPLQVSSQNSSPSPTALKADSLFMEGVRYQLAERTDEALSAYEAALTLRSDHAAACYAIATIKAGEQRWSEAVVYSEKAARLEPDNLWYKVLQVQVYRLTMQIPKAIEVLGKLRRLDSANLEYAYQQSDLYLAQGDINAAVRVYDELEQMYEPCDEWSMQKYKLLTSVGKLAAARSEIEKISAFVPGETKYYEILAQMSIKSGDYNTAYKYYQKILALKPDDAYTYAALADFYRKTGSEEKALDALLRAVLSSGLDDDTRLTLVATFFSDRAGVEPTGKEVKLYADLLDTLLVMYPVNARLYHVKGLLEWRLGRIENAHRYLEKSLSLDDKAYQPYMVMMYVLQDLQNWSLMSQYAQAALKYYPESTVFYVYTTFAQGNMDSCANTIFWGEQALKRLPYVPGEDHELWGLLLYNYVGDCYYQTGRYADYQRLMNEALSLFPQDAGLKNNYAYCLTLMNTCLEEAVQLAAQACKAEPEHYSFWDTYAWALFRSGDVAAAYTAAKKALKAGGGKVAIVWEHTGDILYHLQKTDKAVEAWKKALNLYKPEEAPESLKRKIEKRQWEE